MESRGKKEQFLINITYLAVILALIYVVFKYFIHLVMPFFLALIFASVIRPVVRLLRKKLRLPEGLAGILVTILFFMTIGLLLVLLGVRLVSRLGDLFTLVPQLYRDTLEPGLVNLFTDLEQLAARYGLNIEETLESVAPQILSAAGNAVTSVSGKVVTWVSSLVTKVPGFLVGLLICIVATFFMSADYDRMSPVLLNLLPKGAQQVAESGKNTLKRIILEYGRSYALILSITFAELLLGLFLLKINKFALIAFIIAVLDILPILGTGTVLLPWCVISFIQENPGRGVGLLALYLCITVIRQIIEPKIIGKHVGLHPLITLICMFVGTSLFGVLGLFGLPILMAIILELNSSGVIHIFPTVSSREPEALQAEPLDQRKEGPPEA